MHRRAALPFITGLALVLATAPAARAAPGDLDPTFGGDGVVRTDLTPAEDDGFAVTIQPDGKIVVAGEMGIGGPNPRFAIVRYETDGSLDPSFGGGDGKVSIDFTPRDDFAVRRPHPGGREDRRRRRGRVLRSELALRAGSAHLGRFARSDVRRRREGDDQHHALVRLR